MALLTNVTDVASTNMYIDYNYSTPTSILSTAQIPLVKPWSALRQSIPMIVILTIAYLVVLTLGVINNSLVVLVIYRNPMLRTVTNYFIANLAVADILVCLLVLPITLLSNIFEGMCY